MDSFDREFVDLDGLRLSYQVAGTGDPLVFLHGGGIDEGRLSWRTVAPAFTDEFRVYVPDWPGYGESDAPEGTPTVEYYAEVLARFYEALGIDSATLVGISMGGGVALSFVFGHPDRVERLVAVDSYGLGGSVPGGRLGAAMVGVPGLLGGLWWLLRRSDRLLAAAIRGIVGPGGPTDDLLADVRAATRRPEAGEAFAAFQRHEVGLGGLRTNFLDRLPDLSVPTLFVHGERDPVVPVEWAVRAATLADAEVRVLPGVGHWSPREDADGFVRAVRPFLAA
ncbi:alpha/beta fold hydrolase [Halomarina salina]|uniref:Alpha/beta fold hydrolase n=1 Tax=Halomarina salina TaxID=1872699 RepID=A0ABD5RR73_9EURY|nr:alpha/beta hydrolase [Halomarina salina]